MRLPFSRATKGADDILLGEGGSGPSAGRALTGDPLSREESPLLREASPLNQMGTPQLHSAPFAKHPFGGPTAKEGGHHGLTWCARMGHGRTAGAIHWVNVNYPPPKCIFMCLSKYFHKNSRFMKQSGRNPRNFLFATS